MNEQQRAYLEDYLNNVAKKLHKDMVVHIDIYEETSIVICFWDRYNAIYYNHQKTFRFKTQDFENVFENEVKPFFNI